jgi:rod shape-determining protein MreB
MIGERTAEEIKMRIGTAWVTQENRDRYMEVRGRDLVSGLPKTINISSQESWVALEEPVYAVIDAVKKVLEITPPELAADIVDNGIVMTGGGSLLDGFATLLSVETNLPVHVADDAISCVAIGTGKALNEIHVLSKSGRGPKRLV